MRRRLLRPSKQAAVLAVAGLLAVGILASRAVRRVSLGSEFQYIPRESELIVATGSVKSLWEGAQQALSSALAVVEEDEEMAKELDELRTALRKAKIPIEDVDDLAKYGLDVDRGLLVGFGRPTAGFSFVAVVPVVGKEAVLDGLAALFDERPKEKNVAEKGAPPLMAYDGPGVLFAFPTSDVAVVSSSSELLRRSLTLRAQNLAHAGNNDSLYAAAQRVARGPLMAGPNVFAYWQSRTAPFDERAGILRLGADGIELEAEVELAGGTLRVVDDLRRRSPTDAPWLDALPGKTLALAVLQDEQLTRYRQFVGEELLGLPARTAGADLDHFEGRLPAVRRVAVAMTDLQDGLPDFMVGLWGERPELETMLAQLQREYRRDRDASVLEAAVAEYRRLGGATPSVADLERLDLLAREEHSLFHRFPIAFDKIGDPEFQPEDFATSTYERHFRGHRIRFIVPTLGSNDRRYRSDLATADPGRLAGDRYRLATVFHQGALWVATNVGDLETLLGAPPAGDRHERSAVLAAMPAGAKFHAVVDVERLLTLSLLSPGSMSPEVEQMVRYATIALKDIARLELDALPTRNEAGLRMSVRLAKGSTP